MEASASGRWSGSGDATIASLLAALEAGSRARPDRLLRLRGILPSGVDGSDDGGEPFELLIFRGFSSLTTHPTDFDPDRAALPEGSVIAAAELLQAPLDPASEGPLAGPLPADHFLDPHAWL